MRVAFESELMSGMVNRAEDRDPLLAVFGAIKRAKGWQDEEYEILGPNHYRVKFSHPRWGGEIEYRWVEVRLIGGQPDETEAAPLVVAEPMGNGFNVMVRASAEAPWIVAAGYLRSGAAHGIADFLKAHPAAQAAVVAELLEGAQHDEGREDRKAE